MTDARERRRQHAEETKKADPLGALKKYRVPLVIMIVWLAIVGYNVAAQKGIVGDPSDGCPGHWHAMTQVYLDDGDSATGVPIAEGSAILHDKVTLSSDLNRRFHDDTSNGFHLHDGSGRIHMHPGTERCIELGDVYNFLGLSIDSNSVDVSPQYNYGAQFAAKYENNETHELRVYERDWNYATESHGDSEDWKRISSNNIPKFLEDQIGNGDQVLITFVPKDVDPAVIKEQQDSVGFIGDSYIPGTDSIFMPVLAATMFALVAILIWRSFAKAAAKA